MRGRTLGVISLRHLTADPMLRLLALAMVLAVIVPVSGHGRALAGALGNGAVFVLFWLNGLRIARSEVRAGLANARFLAPLLVWVFGGMALVGLVLSRLAAAVLPGELAIGFLYLGTLTSTVQSAAAYTALAGGTVALSVVSAALLNLAGVFLTVPLFAALGGGEASAAIGSDAALKILLLLVLPFALGQLLQRRLQAFTARHRGRIVWIDRFVIALAVYVAVSGAVAGGVFGTVSGGAWLWLGMLVCGFLLLGHGGAWSVAGVLGLSRGDRIAFLFAGAQKSAAVGAPLATVLFGTRDAGFVVMPLLLYHLLQLVVAAPLASRLSSPRSSRDCGDCSEPTTTATDR